MCGINGFNFQNETLVRTMNEQVSHRGPDDRGVWVHPHVSLGQTRLSIIDLSPGGHQPMVNESQTVTVVFNGEIYNYRELRIELEQLGHVFKTKSDTEVILKLYEQEGEACFKKCNGIFAIAIWDEKKQTMILARDHLGVKPLYYYWKNDQLIFSSEIKAILAHDIPRQVNWEAANMYFRLLYVPAPLTMFAGINKLPPATCAILKNNQLTFHTFWKPEVSETNMSYAEAVETVRSTVSAAVKRQLVSDRPVGLFLSGGIDSTIIAGLATEYSTDTLHTFSAGFDVAPQKFNADLDLARITSKRLGTTHHELIVTGKDCAREFFNCIYHLDEPIANATQVATYLLSKIAKSSVAVSLGGDGGDELFGGYQRYKYSRYSTRAQSVPGVAAGLRVVSAIFPQQNWAKKFTVPPGYPRYLQFMAQKESALQRVLKQPELQNSRVEVFLKSHNNQNVCPDSENQLMWLDLQHWLPEESLMRSDKMSMAFGLEQRVPFLDIPLTELALSLPYAYKIKGQNQKRILKDAYADLIPESIRQQPKRGWFSPGSEWLRTDLHDMARMVFQPDFNPGMSEWIDFKEVNRLYQEHCDRTGYHLNLLWSILTFQVWYHIFFVEKRKS